MMAFTLLSAFPLCISHSEPKNFFPFPIWYFSRGKLWPAPQIILQQFYVNILYTKCSLVASLPEQLTREAGQTLINVNRQFPRSSIASLPSQERSSYPNSVLLVFILILGVFNINFVG